MSRPVDPRLLRAVCPLRRFVMFDATGLVVGAVLTVVQAGILADIIARVFAHGGTLRVLVGALVALGIVGCIRAVLAAALDFAGSRASVRTRAALRGAAVSAIARLGPEWARRQQPGRLATITGPGLEALDGYVTRALPAVVSAAVVPVTILAAITWVDPQSGLVLVVMLPLVPVFMALVGLTTRSRARRQYLLLARLSGQFLDLLRGLTTLRIYGQAARQEAVLRRNTDRYRAETLAALRITFLSSLVLDLISALAVAVVAVDVGLRLDSGGLDFRSALLVLVLAPEVFAPLRAMAAQYHANEDGMAAAAAALEVIDSPELTDREAPRPASLRGDPARPSGGAELEAVTVRYPDRTVPALHDVDLVVSPGQCCAITGPSGAGKSTLLATLMAWVQPAVGAVLVGTAAGLRPLGELDPRAWRRGTAWVPQRPVPTQDSVAGEVRLGDSSATDAEVARACHDCAAPEPGTPLGQDGGWVSAGQRRRIALARALLRARSVRAAGGVPLVILDEPSEDLDAATEATVARVIASMRGWATVVLVTHSDAILDLADHRVVLDRGRITSDRISLCWAGWVDPVPAEAGCVQDPAHPASPPRLSPEASPARSPGECHDNDRRPDARTSRTLWALVRTPGLRGRVWRAAALAALAGLAGLALTATSFWLISRAAQHPNVQALAVAVVGVRTFAIGRALLRYLERLGAHDAALRMLTNVRVQVFGALLPLTPSALGSYRRGDLLRRFAADVDGVQDGLVRTFVPIVGAVATCGGAVLLAALIDPAAAAVLAAGLIIAGVAAPALAARVAGRRAAELTQLAGRRDARAAALCDGLAELSAFDALSGVQADIAADDQRFASQSWRAARAAAVGLGLAGVVGAVTLPLVLAVAAPAVRAGGVAQVNIAVLAACVLAGFEAVAPLAPAAAAWTRARAGLARVDAVIDAAQRVPDPSGTAQLPGGPVGIEARGLSVAPAAGAPEVVSDLDLVVRPGEHVAVVGHSGSGKSTLLAALLRQLPASGLLRLCAGPDRVDVRDVGSARYSAAVAGSLQGDHVFDATMGDNLRVVRPAADDVELDEAARRAGLSEFIRDLPRGWDTPAGPDGTMLSGGQRQRLLLARAFLARPDVLVLDEPTAHLDAETERAVLADLFAATSGRTLLLTTHRRAPLDGMDVVLSLDD